MKKSDIRLLNIFLVTVLLLSLAVVAVISPSLITGPEVIAPPVINAPMAEPTGDNVIYVDAAADVDGDGTKAAPFDTIQAAVKVAKSGDIVYIRDGEYYVDKPIALTKAQNGITLQAASVAGVRIYGATKVTGWTEGENGIWSVPYTGEVPHTLYEGDTRAIKARYPNREYDAEFITSAAGYLLTIDTDLKNQNRILIDPSDWNDFSFSNITDANIVIWPWNDCDWAKYTVKIVKIDPKTGTITPNYTTDSGAPYGLDCRYYIEGMLELLDAPGEFYYDSTAKMLHYKPLYGGDPNETGIYVPVTDEIFTVTDAKDITFKGLSLEKTNFLQTMKIWYNHNETRKGAVTMRGSSNITFQNCRFKNTGLHGIYIASNGKNNADNNVIDGCLFENMGISGVILESHARADASRMVGNKVTNCLMHDLGELAVDCAGVNIWSTQKTVVENCEFYNSPRYAVSIRGACSEGGGIGSNLAQSGQSKENVVQNCLIYYTNQDSGDTGALHTAGVSYPGENGNINYFRNIYIDHVLPHETMKDYAPNGYFGDYFSNHQSFENIRITDCNGAANRNRVDAFTNLTQIRFNKTQASTSIYLNTSWVVGFQNTGLDYTNMGLTENYPLELLPNVDSIRKSVVLKTNSKVALDNGVLISLGEQVAQTDVPAIDVAHAVGAIVEKKGNSLTISLNGKSFKTNKAMVSAKDLAHELGLNLLETDGLLIFSQEENLFDTVRDSMTLKRLGNLLFENYQAKCFKHEVIESAYGDYTATGTDLREGEYYLLRSSASKNAVTYAVGKRNGQVVYVVREDNHSVPTVQVLGTEGNKVNFTKVGNTLTITVDDKQIAQVDNPFDVVFAGTYTKNGAENTLTVGKNGMSIAPNEPVSLNIRLPKAEIGISEQVRYVVTLIDKDGKEYDLTNEALTISVADSAIAEAKDGYVQPKKIGKTTLTASVTVNGTALTGSVEINVVQKASILLKDSFDANELFSAVWAVTDLQGDSYVKVNSDHMLEIHSGRGNSESVFASCVFPETAGTIALEFDFTPDFGIAGSGDAALAYLMDTSGSYCVSTFAFKGSFAYYDGKTGKVVQIPMDSATGKTYHIRLVANTDTNTFDFYVDDTAVVIGAAFRAKADKLSGVLFAADAPRVTHCWDNIVVKKLDNMLHADYNAENFKHQEIGSGFEDYTATGAGLQEGEYYMVSSASGTNATVYHAIGKQNGKLVYITRNNSYSIPTVTELDTSGNAIVFAKKGNQFSITVDGKQIVKMDNPFNVVYVGTYTTSGSNKLTVTKDGMSISPAVPDSLVVRLSKPEIALADTADYVVTLIDKNGKSYDITGTKLEITMTDNSIAEIKNGVVQPKKVGTTTMKVSATVNGIKLTGSVEVKVVKVSTILLNDSFDDNELSPVLWITANTSSVSYAKVNDKHQLELHSAVGNTAAVSARRVFTATAGIISLEFDFTPDFSDAPNAGAALAYFQDNKAKYCVSTFAYEGAFAYFDYEVGDVVKVPMECESGKTYHVRLVANTKTQTFDLYVDGKPVVTGERFRNQADMLSGVFFAANHPGVTHCWDNILVKLEPES